MCLKNGQTVTGETQTARETLPWQSAVFRIKDFRTCDSHIRSCKIQELLADRFLHSQLFFFQSNMCFVLTGEHEKIIIITGKKL